MTRRERRFLSWFLKQNHRECNREWNDPTYGRMLPVSRTARRLYKRIQRKYLQTSEGR